MSMIFPGMDPYLEDPLVWDGFHNSLVVYLAGHLQPLLRPRYIAAVEERVLVEGPDERQVAPDIVIKRTPERRKRSPSQAVAVLEAPMPQIVTVPELEIHENYIEVLDRQSGKRVVTIIEITGPTNKYRGPGRDSYLKKQKEVRVSSTHLVEIDLLRKGHHVLAVLEWIARGKEDYDYLACVNRSQPLREKFELYPWLLREPIPKIGIPLAQGDRDVVLDLNVVFAHTYEMGAYRDRLDYNKPCRPPLARDDQSWANRLIRKAKAANSRA